MVCFSHPKDSLKWVVSPLWDKTSLFSVGRDNRDHAVQSSPYYGWRKWDSGSENSPSLHSYLLPECLSLWPVHSSTSSCHYCYHLTWFHIFLYSIMHPFQFHSTHIHWEFNMSPVLGLVLETLWQTLETSAEWQSRLLRRKCKKMD